MKLIFTADASYCLQNVQPCQEHTLSDSDAESRGCRFALMLSGFGELRTVHRMTASAVETRLMRLLLPPGRSIRRLGRYGPSIRLLRPRQPPACSYAHQKNITDCPLSASWRERILYLNLAFPICPSAPWIPLSRLIMILTISARMITLQNLPQINASLVWIGPLALFSCALLIFVFFVHSSWKTRRLLSKEHGCQTINNRKHLSYYGLLFGIDFMYDSYRAAASSKFLSNTYALYSRLGTTWSTRILGNTVIQTVDPDNLRAVYNTNFRDWGLGNFRVQSFRPLLGHGIFAIEGAEWRRSRDLLRPAFAKSEVINLEVYEKHFRQLLVAIPGATADDGVVDLQPLFFRLTMDSATEVIFGRSIHSLSTDKKYSSAAKTLGEAYEKAKSEIFHNILLYPFGKWRWWSGLMPAVKQVHAFIDPVVEEAIATAQHDQDLTADEFGEKRPYSFLRELAQRTTCKEKIRGELLSVLLASRDTTAALLSNTVFVLARRPDIVSRLLDELAPLEGHPPTYPQLKKLTYLDAVLKECMCSFSLFMFASSRNHSTPPPTRRPNQHARRDARNHPATRRRPRRRQPRLRRARHPGRHVHLRAAPRSAIVGRRCG